VSSIAELFPVEFKDALRRYHSEFAPETCVASSCIIINHPLQTSSGKSI
jgi:hypothetical protein